MENSKFKLYFLVKPQLIEEISVVKLVCGNERLDIEHCIICIQNNIFSPCTLDIAVLCIQEGKREMVINVNMW